MEGPPDAPAPPALTPDEAVALEEAVTLALAAGRRIVDPGPLEAACAARGVGHDAWYAAMKALAGRDLVQLRTTPPSAVQLLSVRDEGLFTHLRRSGAGLEGLEQRLWDAVVAAPAGQALELHEQVGAPALLVEAVLDRWVAGRRLVYSKAPGRRFRVHRVLDGPDPAGVAGG